MPRGFFDTPYADFLLQDKPPLHNNDFFDNRKHRHVAFLPHGGHSVYDTADRNTLDHDTLVLQQSSTTCSRDTVVLLT
jgi:hypothetical protein